MQIKLILCTLHTSCVQQDRWLYVWTAESTLVTAHKWLEGPYSIATKTHVTAAFLLFVLVPIGGAAVPVDKMSIQTCGPTTSPPGCVVLGPDMSSIWTHPPHPIQGGGEMGWSEIDKITFLTIGSFTQPVHRILRTTATLFSTLVEKKWIFTNCVNVIFGRGL